MEYNNLYGQLNTNVNSNINNQQQFMYQNQRFNNQMFVQQQQTFAPNSQLPYSTNLNNQSSTIQHQQHQQYSQPIQQQYQTGNNLAFNTLFTGPLVDRQGTTEPDNFLIDNQDLVSDSENSSNRSSPHNRTISKNGFSTRETENRGRKRSGVDSNSPATAATNNSNKKNKHDEIKGAPLIYFRISHYMVKNPILLEKTILEALKESKISLRLI